MNKVIFFHIGIGKTGTSSIQRMLSLEYQDKSARDFLYPETGRHEDAHHLLADFKAARMSTAVKALYGTLIDEVLNSSFSKVVISSEQFCFLKKEYINEVLDFFTEFELRVIVYVRNQLDLIPSAYIQNLKQKSFDGSLKKFFDLHKRSFFYSARLNPWKDLLGRKAIIVRQYDAPKIKRDVCSDFMSVIGCPDRGQKFVGENISFNPQYHSLLREFDRIEPRSGLRDAFLLFLNEISANVPRQRPRSILCDELAKEIENLYRNDNVAIFDEYIRKNSVKCYLNKP